MISVEYEFKRGYFFIRPYGNITVKNYNELITDIDIILNKVGIKNVVINIDNIKSIDLTCLDGLVKYIREMAYSGINMFLCDKDKTISNRLFKNIVPSISIEKEVYNLI